MGSAILESVYRDGLLLVPEELTWLDPTQRSRTDRISATQRRICFTELAQDELPDHARAFGGFALEFPVPELRSPGALPGIYVPDAPDNAPPSSCALGAAFLSYLAGARQLLATVGDSAASGGNALKLTGKMKDGRTVGRRFSVEEAAAIKEFISIAEEVEGMSFRAPSNAISRLASLFYPLENLEFTGPLGYYRQRE